MASFGRTIRAAICALVFAIAVNMSSGQTIPDQDWGYVQISKQYNSNMFWWLYGATVPQRQSVPLVMWLQGGPGGSSLFGDFIEIGPLDVNLKPRNSTWLSQANLIFVDNPVGTGFSYTVNPDGFSTTDQQIADNLVFFLQTFLKKYPVFESMDFWIFCESYGGKMTANFGVALDQAIKRGKVQINFKGVGLGDSWIDPVGCMYSYSDFLFGASLIDENQAQILSTYADKAQAALNQGLGVNATGYWGSQQDKMEEFTGNVNVYNFLTYAEYTPDEQLSQLLNGPLRKQLKIIPANVTWGGQSLDVFQYMMGDFMKPAISAVDYLLKNGYQVAVYSGQLDVIVDVLCTDGWIQKLTWSGLPSYQTAPRKILSINGVPNGYVKSYENLSMWNINRAGHMVPYDNPAMALDMFTTIITGKKK